MFRKRWNPIKIGYKRPEVPMNLKRNESESIIPTTFPKISGKSRMILVNRKRITADLFSTEEASTGACFFANLANSRHIRSLETSSSGTWVQYERGIGSLNIMDPIPTPDLPPASPRPDRWAGEFVCLATYMYCTTVCPLTGTLTVQCTIIVVSVCHECL